MDTIFALATARGRAGVAIIRISGPDALLAAGKLCGAVPLQRGVRRLIGRDGELIDEALVLRFEHGQSFTGEDVVELHTHGSPAVAQAVLRELGEGCREAEPGEFTRRALENGRLDLAQVEGLADLIDAETEAQRKQAVRVFDGALGDLASTWRFDLVRAAALIEATIDFADEDVPENVLPEVDVLLRKTQVSMQAQVSGVDIAERIRDGFEVAIVGMPNAGKSTLLNRLAGRDAAITSEIAGTTRDVIEVRMDLDGLAVTLLDTAGLRDTEDQVEKMGVELAIKRAKNADLRIFLGPQVDIGIPMIEGDISVEAKADMRHDDAFAVSGHTGEGVDVLIQRLSSVLADRVSGVGVAIRERHRVAIAGAVSTIANVLEMISRESDLDLIADELRATIRAVDSIVGRVDVEDLLDEIFASFCIGK